MTSAVFPKAKEQLLKAGIDLSSEDVRAMLVRAAYVYDAADEFVADLGAVDNGRSAALGSKTFSNGVFDAADTSLTATAANECNAIVLFAHTGNDATARLIAYLDNGVGVPFIPEASQVCPIAWDNGPMKIFQL